MVLQIKFIAFTATNQRTNNCQKKTKVFHGFEKEAKLKIDLITKNFQVMHPAKEVLYHCGCRVHGRGSASVRPRDCGRASIPRAPRPNEAEGRVG